MFSEFLRGPQPEGLEKHKKRILEDEEAIGRVLPELIAQKRAGKNAPAGSNEIMKQNAMSVKGKGDKVEVKTPKNWKGTPILKDNFMLQ